MFEDLLNWYSSPSGDRLICFEIFFSSFSISSLWYWLRKRGNWRSEEKRANSFLGYFLFLFLCKGCVVLFFICYIIFSISLFFGWIIGKDDCDAAFLGGIFFFFLGCCYFPCPRLLIFVFFIYLFYIFSLRCFGIEKIKRNLGKKNEYMNLFLSICLYSCLSIYLSSYLSV